MAVQSAHRRVEREQALNYIIGSVHKSIGPNQVTLFIYFLFYFFVQYRLTNFLIHELKGERGVSVRFGSA